MIFNFFLLVDFLLLELKLQFSGYLQKQEVQGLLDTFLLSSGLWEDLGIEPGKAWGLLTCAEMKYELLMIVSRYSYLHFVAFMSN